MRPEASRDRCEYTPEGGETRAHALQALGFAPRRIRSLSTLRGIAALAALCTPTIIYHCDCPYLVKHNLSMGYRISKAWAPARGSGGPAQESRAVERERGPRGLPALARGVPADVRQALALFRGALAARGLGVAREGRDSILHARAGEVLVADVLRV